MRDSCFLWFWASDLYWIVVYTVKYHMIFSGYNSMVTMGTYWLLLHVYIMCIVLLCTCIYMYSFANIQYWVSSVSHRINIGGVHQWYIIFGLQCSISVIKWCFSSLRLKVKGRGVPWYHPLGETLVSLSAVQLLTLIYSWQIRG